MDIELHFVGTSPTDALTSEPFTNYESARAALRDGEYIYTGKAEIRHIVVRTDGQERGTRDN